MRRLSIILISITIQFLAISARSQGRDSTDQTMETMGELYINNSPLDYLKNLKADFKRRNQPNHCTVGVSPSNWIKEEHIPELLKLIYSTNSLKSIMAIYSSNLVTDKFSSVGREAQNLIECFRTKERYPLALNSFGPPDRVKGKELEVWWKKYKLEKL